MCYPKPGPRCSAHAREALERAMKDAGITNEADAMWFPNVMAARRVWDATQEGHKALTREIDGMRTAGEHPGRIAQLELRRAEGTRKHMMELRALKAERGESLEILRHEVPTQSWVDTVGSKEILGGGGSFDNVLVRDSENGAQFYAKVRYSPKTKEREAYLMVCDMEKNPNAETHLSSEQAMAVLAKKYDVDAVSFSGMFTPQGWKAFQRMRANGAPVKVDDGGLGTQFSHPTISVMNNSMTFVNNWDTADFVYPL